MRFLAPDLNFGAATFDCPHLAAAPARQSQSRSHKLLERSFRHGINFSHHFVALVLLFRTIGKRAGHSSMSWPQINEMRERNRLAQEQRNLNMGDAIKQANNAGMNLDPSEYMK